MAPSSSDRLDPVTKAAQYLHSCLTKNKFFFTLEFVQLEFIEPYSTEYNPACPLGRPLNHTEDPRSLLPIPKLLNANCLDRDQYPWNTLRSESDGWFWDRERHKLYQKFNVAAYKAQRSTLIDPKDPMSTITALAQQSSYP